MVNTAVKEEKVLNPQDLTVFCSQLALLVKSGIGLDDGMEAMGQSMSKEGAQMLSQVRQTYLETYTLSTALESSGVFPEYMVKMVQIGEDSGNLEGGLEGLTVYYDNQSRMMRQIRQAILSPAMSIFAMTLVVAVLVWKVVPIFTDVMQSLGGPVTGAAELGPLLGKIVLVFLVVLLAAILSGCWAMKMGKGQAISRILSVFPGVSRAKEKFFTARFANVLSMLLAGGYQTEQALERIPGLLPDGEFRSRVQAIHSRMEEGQSLAQAVNEEKIFPGLYAGMLWTGEKTGSMDTVLHKLAQIYQAEALEEIERLIALVEPILVGALSASVGAILFSVMLPLLGIMFAIG